MLRALLLLALAGPAGASPLTDREAADILAPMLRLDPRRAPEVPDVAVPVPALRGPASVTRRASWRGIGRALELGGNPSMIGGIEVRFTLDGDSKSVPQHDLRFYPATLRLTVEQDLGIPVGHPIWISYHDAAAVDSIAVQLPPSVRVLPLWVQLYLVNVRHDKSKVEACEMTETSGVYRRLRVGGLDGSTDTFAASEMDVDLMMRLLDSWHGCVGRAFPDYSGYP